MTGSAGFILYSPYLHRATDWPVARFNVIRKCAPGPFGSNSSAAPLASASSPCTSQAGLPGRVVKNGSKIWARHFRRNAGVVVWGAHIYGIAHVAGTGDDADAAVLLLAVARRCERGIQQDLVQMAAVEDNLQVGWAVDQDAPSRDTLCLHDFLDQQADELVVDVTSGC